MTPNRTKLSADEWDLFEVSLAHVVLNKPHASWRSPEGSVLTTAERVAVALGTKGKRLRSRVVGEGRGRS